MPLVARALIDLFIMFAAAKLIGALFERLRQPAVIGELLAGVLIGPFVLGWVNVPDGAMLAQFNNDRHLAEESLNSVHHVIAELGVIILLYFIGLETRVTDILRVGKRALATGVLGIVFPFILGLIISFSLGNPTLESLFIATSLIATSVGITARVLRDLGVIKSPEARIILGAAVIDDVLAMIVLAIVSSVSSSGEVSAGSIMLLLLQVLGFVALVAFVGTRAMQRYSAHLDALPIRNAPFAVSVVILLGLASLSAIIGLAAIIGAFLAGMIFAEAREQYDLERATLPLYEFLVPFFFVVTGTQVNPAIFLDGTILSTAALVTLVAVLGKLIGGGLGGLGMGRRSVLILGTGMIPRGEVGLIVAGIGLSLGALPESVFSVVVVMSLATTLIAPPLLKLLYSNYAQPSPTPTTNLDLAQQDGILPDM